MPVLVQGDDLAVEDDPAADDVDTAVLGRVVRAQAADLTLTAAQQQAHRRLCARWVRVLDDPDPLARYTG